jgi:hypothetical protein
MKPGARPLGWVNPQTGFDNYSSGNVVFSKNFNFFYLKLIFLYI